MKPPGAGGNRKGTDRRRSERFDVRNAYADFRKKGRIASGRWHRAVLPQVSSHGCYILTKHPLDYGDRVEAMIHLVAYNEPIHVRGEVVRIKSRPPYYEIGIGFTVIKNSDMEKLGKNKYIEKLIDRRDSELV